MITRFTDGAATIVLTGDLESQMRKVVADAMGGTLAVMEREGMALAADAKAQWYRQVTRETGLSGDIQAVTTLDTAKSEVRVSIGSVDSRTAFKTGKPVAVYVHRPGPLSTVAVEITKEEYSTAKAGTRKDEVFKSRETDKKRGVIAGHYYRIEPNPNPGDGKFLLAELVRKPGTKLAAKMAPEIGRALAARLK